MSWGTRKRNTILFLIFVVILLPVLIFAFWVFYKEPTCFDGKQNSDEAGIDCGGSCQLVCTNETSPPSVLWERFFQVKDGTYSVIAYVENQNPGAGVKSARYKFQLFNKDGIVIADRSGAVKLYPKSVLPIIENGLNTDKQIPVRVAFEFEENLIFDKQEPVKPFLIIKNENYFVENFPKVSAQIQNLKLDPIEDIKIIVLLYDVFNNVIGTSSTFVERLEGEQVKDIIFTWPNNFIEEVSRIEIVPVYELVK